MIKDWFRKWFTVSVPSIKFPHDDYIVPEWRIKLMETEAKHEQERKDLYFALRSRVLTDEEMEVVKRWNYYLTDDYTNVNERICRYNEALMQQFRMRELKRSHGN